MIKWLWPLNVEMAEIDELEFDCSGFKALGPVNKRCQRTIFYNTRNNCSLPLFLIGNVSMLKKIYHWIDRNILELRRELRLSFLPPLMVYLAYGIQGLTAIVGTFFVKDYLSLSAEFLAALAFWAGIPWPRAP